MGDLTALRNNKKKDFSKFCAPVEYKQYIILSAPSSVFYDLCLNFCPCILICGQKIKAFCMDHTKKKDSMFRHLHSNTDADSSYSTTGLLLFFTVS